MWFSEGKQIEWCLSPSFYRLNRGSVAYCIEFLVPAFFFISFIFSPLSFYILFICSVSTCVSIHMPCGDQVTTCRSQVSPSAKWVPGIKIIVGSLYLISQSFQPLTLVSDSVSGILLFPFVKYKRHMRKSFLWSYYCIALFAVSYSKVVFNGRVFLTSTIYFLEVLHFILFHLNFCVGYIKMLNLV